MIKKRFKIVLLNGVNGNYSIEDTFQEIPTFYNDVGCYLGNVEPLCDLLNEQHERFELLKMECRIQNKQKQNLIQFLMDKGYNTLEIRKIVNGGG